MANEKMPREKALEYGISCLSNNELLALIIKSGYKNNTVFSIVDDVLDCANGFNNLLNLSYEELIGINGINKAKALEILAILEIAKRLNKIDAICEDTMKSPEKVINWLRTYIGFSDQELFVAIYLSNSGKIIKTVELYKGSKNQAIVAVDEVYRKAILLKASALIVAHNHPSNSCSPSAQDIDITEKLSKTGKLLGINLLDHIIICKNDYFSFKQNSMC